MRIVVIGGQARKVGKTSVMAGLIRSLRRLAWTAVKISRHGGMIPHPGKAQSPGMALNSGFILTEETAASRATDTGRFLAAGAKRALWLRAETGRMTEAVAALIEALEGEENVMIESTGALRILTPEVGIIVVDRSRRGIKASFPSVVRRAAAVVEVVSGARTAYPSLRLPAGVHRFTVRRQDYSSPELCRFILRKLQGKAGARPLRPDPPRNTSNSERRPRAGTQQK